MNELHKERVTHNFMCRLSPEDHRKLKVIACVNNRSMTSQIRQFIQDDFRLLSQINENNTISPQKMSLNRLAG